MKNKIIATLSMLLLSLTALLGQENRLIKMAASNSAVAIQSEIKDLKLYGKNDLNEALVVASMRNRNTDTIELLVRLGADVNYVTYNLATPILLANEQKNDPRVTATLVKLGAKVNVVTSNGWTPLMLASRNGDLDSTRTLLDAGADLTVKQSNGSTSVAYAIGWSGNLEVVKLLLDRGADVNEVADDGNSLIMMAANNSNPKLIELLLKYKPDLSFRNRELMTAVAIAKAQPKLAGTHAMALLEVASKSVPALYATLNDSNVRIRSEPSTSSKVLGKLMKGEKLIVVSRTLEAVTIDENENFWYSIIAVNGIAGWVFGSFLDIEGN